MMLDKVIMADKKVKPENKLELFAEVLADLESNFVISLEKMLLKVSAINKV